MAIVDVRIDDRLIHGQVCGYWIPYYNIDKIVIIDDDIVNDQMRKTALHFGCPSKTKLSILSALVASDKLKRNLDKGSNVMLLCSNPKPLLEMVNDGYTIKHITVGNMSARDGYKHIKKTVYLSANDIKNFKELATKNIKIDVQLIPDDNPEDLIAEINKI